MHSSFKMHPYSEKFVVRDYFPKANASLFGKIRHQGLLFHGKCIPIRKNSPPGIIFPRRMHPYSEKFVARDYFPETNASLFGKIRCQGLFSRGECIPIRKIRCQGLFSRGECIPIRKNSPPGIIFPRRMYPYSENFVARDYCFMENASLTSYFVESGCIPPSKCIPGRVFLQIRMHSSGK